MRGTRIWPARPLRKKKNTRSCCWQLNLCPCLLYTRHLRYMRLLNLACGGLSRSRVRMRHCSLVRTAVWRIRGTRICSYALQLMCPYCCLEDTRYSNLARSSSASFHTPACTRLSEAEVSNFMGKVLLEISYARRGCVSVARIYGEVRQEIACAYT